MGGIVGRDSVECVSEVENWTMTLANIMATLAICSAATAASMLIASEAAVANNL